MQRYQTSRQVNNDSTADDCVTKSGCSSPWVGAQVQIRRLPKPVVAMVAGYAVGGGHILHMMCDLTIAADNAVFGQTGPKVGSFDAGYGSTQMVRLIGALPLPPWQQSRRDVGFAQFYNMVSVLSVIDDAQLQFTIAPCRNSNGFAHASCTVAISFLFVALLNKWQSAILERLMCIASCICIYLLFSRQVTRPASSEVMHMQSLKCRHLLPNRPAVDDW